MIFILRINPLTFSAGSGSILAENEALGPRGREPGHAQERVDDQEQADLGQGFKARGFTTNRHAGYEGFNEFASKVLETVKRTGMCSQKQSNVLAMARLKVPKGTRMT